MGFGKWLDFEASGWGDNIHAIGMDDSLYDPEMALQPELEMRAQAIHTNYRIKLKNDLAQATTEAERQSIQQQHANQSWKQLAPEIRLDNRENANRYDDYLHFHGLSVEGAEALAEYWHKRMRQQLGIAAEDSPNIDELFKQKYQGSRYSFGYPACPRLEDHVPLFRLLGPERIGVSLSEEFQIVPEQSTSALISHHPEARYFSITSV